jgi:hypothetical protein
MIQFACPYLKGEIELTEEREHHIAARHPDLLPQLRERIAETLSAPDHVRTSTRFVGARLFSLWYNDSRGGKYLVVVVVSESDTNGRHWIITAYTTRRLAEGAVEWKRN